MPETKFIEHMHGVNGLQPRGGRARMLIKDGNVCRNCSNFYTLKPKQKRQSVPYAYIPNEKPIPACNLHNCQVHEREWCKHHRSKKTGKKTEQK